MAIILKICVRFTLKELRYELSSSFDIVSDCEARGILFLQIAVMFGMKIKRKRLKKTSCIIIFSQTRRKKTIQKLKTK